MHYFDGPFGKSGATVRKAFQPPWMRKCHQRLAAQQPQPWMMRLIISANQWGKISRWYPDGS